MNLRQREPLIFDRSVPGKVGLSLPKLGVAIEKANMIEMMFRSLP